MGFLDLFEEYDALRIKLTQKGKSRRFGIIDGSFWGDMGSVFLSLTGKINILTLIESYLKRGKELAASHKILDQIPNPYRKALPNCS